MRPPQSADVSSRFDLGKTDPPASPKKTEFDFEQDVKDSGREKKSAARSSIELVGSILRIGKEHVNLAEYGLRPEFSPAGEALFAVAYGDSSFTLSRAKDGSKKMEVSMVIAGESLPVIVVSKQAEILYQVNSFKESVRKITSGRLNIRSIFNDVQEKLSDSTPEELAAGSEDDASDVGSETEQSRMAALGRDFDKLLEEPNIKIQNQPDIFVSQTKIERLKKDIAETLYDTKTVSSDQKKNINRLIAELGSESAKKEYKSSVEISFSHEDDHIFGRNDVATVEGIASAGGPGSRYDVKNDAELRENRTAQVCESTPEGRLGTAIIDAETAKAQNAMVRVLGFGLKRDTFSTATILGAAAVTQETHFQEDEVSLAAVTVSRAAEVELGAWGSTGVLTVRGGKRLPEASIEQATQTSNESAAITVEKQIALKKFIAKDHDQIIQANAGFWNVVSEYEVEKMAGRYRGKSLQDALFRLAYERNNSTKEYTIKTSAREKITQRPYFGEGESIVVQVVHIERPEERGLLSKIASSKVGKWLRAAALVTLGLSGKEKSEPVPEKIMSSITSAATVQRGKEAFVVSKPRIASESLRTSAEITIENRRGNEHELVRLVNERNKISNFVGTTTEDKGRIIFVAAILKQLLRGTDCAGFSAADFKKNIDQTQSGDFTIKNTDIFDQFLDDAAAIAKQKRHIATVMKYAAGPYSKDLQ